MTGGVLAEPRLVALIPGLGLLSALAFLPGEALSRQDLLTYVLIWLAVMVLVREGVWRGRRMRRRQRVTVMNLVVVPLSPTGPG